MRWSKLFIPTLREDPAEAESVSQRLLQRAGYLRPSGDLFLGQRTRRKLCAIVHDEMDRIGGQEMRFDHDRAVAEIARGGLRSYKQLPQVWYQTEAMRSWSFDLTPEGLDATYQQHHQAYLCIFVRCGLKVVSTGTGHWRDFLAVSETGGDSVATCAKCGAIAVAQAKAPVLPDPEEPLPPEPFHTPGRKTIAEVAEFTGLPATSQMKSLVMVADGRPVLALLRGDDQLNEAKLAEAMGGAAEVRPATPVEIQKWFGAAAGSLGPVGVNDVQICADLALQGRRNMISGANRDDYHLRNVTPGEDFEAEFRDLRRVVSGDLCTECGTEVAVQKAMAAGQLRKLGNRYAERMELHVVDPGGKAAAPFMGAYGLAIDGILSAAVEQNHDKDGLVLPASLAPFQVVVTPVNFADAGQREGAEAIYQACGAQGLDALLDDRDERAGVKFKDADLIGIPWRVVVGKKLPQGLVELVNRRTREPAEVASGDVAGVCAQRLGLS